MLSSFLHTVSFVCVLSAPVCVSAVATETVVGVAGQVVTLPCRVESAKQSDVEVCWGRGKPSLFTCHNTLISAAGDDVRFQRSERVSVSSSSSLSIVDSQLSDSGFYHCRVQLPGLFNDQMSTVHLIMILPQSGISEQLHKKDTMKLRELHTTTKSLLGRDITEKTGSDSTEPVVALVQSRVLQEPVNTLLVVVGNTLRLAFIIFIPALLLTAAYRVWRSKQSSVTDRRPDQSEEEDSV